MSLFFAHRDESDIVYKDDTLIRDEDDVIKVMDRYFSPDNGEYVIRAVSYTHLTLPTT